MSKKNSPRPESFLYSTDLNRFARRYLATGTILPPTEKQKVARELVRLMGRFAENIMFHGGVSLSVYGENIPLALLVGALGPSGVEQLLEEGALEFALENVSVIHPSEPIDGLDPIGALQLTSKTHCDPEESAKRGLRWHRGTLTKAQERTLVRRAAEAYVVGSEDLAKNAASLAKEAYRHGLFTNLGLSPTKDIQRLNQAETKLLSRLAQETLDLAILGLHGYDTLESRTLASLVSAELDRLEELAGIEQAARRVFEIENLPALGDLVARGVLPIVRIPDLRRSSDAVRFREWLHDLATPLDAGYTSSRYVDSIVGRSGFWKRSKGKWAKILTVTALSTGLGSAVAAGPVAGTIGAGGVFTLGAALNLGFSVLDTFVLNRVLRGWNPKSFVERVKAEAEDALPADRVAAER